MKFRKKSWMSRLFRMYVYAVKRKYRRLFRRRAAHLLLGERGERLASRVLTELGVEVLCRNYRNRYGEIDIIGLDGETLCFIEVKSRHWGQFGRPADAVTSARRRRYARAGLKYMKQVGLEGRIRYRFDIMEVLFEGRRVKDMTYIRDAFHPVPHGPVW